MQKSLGARLLRSCISKMVFAALFALFAGSSIFAQLPTGTILGAIKDSTGGAVPNAQVTLTNVETNATRTATTGNDGEYRVPALQPGHYSVKVEKSGFKTVIQSGITLDVAEEIVISPVLEVGASEQQITVTGEAPLVNTQTSALGGLVSDEKMAELPLNGRNFVDLALLQPGVTNDTNFANTNGQGGNWGVMFSSNGAPVRSNTFTLDGALMMDIHGNTGGAIGTTLGVDGIKEYRVISDAFGAEYGMQMGSQVVIVSKGGTNQFHGDVFEYLRNRVLDARNFFDYSYTTTGERLPELQRNNFGGSFGGPIRKDKTFFYAVFEGLRQNQGATIIDNVFPANCLVNSGNPCATSSGGNVAASIQPLLALYPSPNLPKNQFTFPFIQPSTVNYGQIRLDQNLSNSDSLFGRYTIQDSSNTNASGYPQFGLLTEGRDQFVTVSENHIFSPTLLNTARLSLSRTNIATAADYPASLVGPQFSFVPGQALGTLSVGGVTSFGPSGSAPTSILQNVYTLSDDVYYTKGKHAFKFGVLFNRFENYDVVTTNERGTLSFSSMASFLAGLQSSASVITPGSDLDRIFRFYTYGFYAQDDWRVTPRLTLNLGLRYEISTTPYDRYGRNYAFRNIATDTTTVQGAVFRNPSFKNFGPRIGFAWDVFGNGKTSVHSAFGEYYDVANEGYVMYSQGKGTPPLSSTSALGSGKTAITFPLAFGLPGAQGSALNTSEYNIQQPHLLQWNLTLEQQLTPTATLSVSYVGTRGIHLWTAQEGNPCFPTAIVNGVPNWLTNGAPGIDCPVSPLNPTNTTNGRLNAYWGGAQYEATASDSYFNSLQVMATKRVSHGLQIQGAYTYGKVLDDTQGEFGPSECVSNDASNGEYPFNPKVFDKGPACFDVKHNIRMNMLYHFPTVKMNNALARGVLGGWWVGTLVSWETGFPFMPVVGTWRSLSDHLMTSNSGGGNTDRANIGVATVAPGQTGPDGTVNSTANTFIPFNPATAITGNPQQWFNPLMFTPGPLGYLGTVSRDMLRGPHLSNVDFSINKDTPLRALGEAGQVEFRAEFFNIFNHANFGMPAGQVYSGTVTDKSEFDESPVGATASNPLGTAGSITNTVTASRQIQLSIKILF